MVIKKNKMISESFTSEALFESDTPELTDVIPVVAFDDDFSEDNIVSIELDDAKDNLDKDDVIVPSTEDTELVSFLANVINSRHLAIEEYTALMNRIATESGKPEYVAIIKDIMADEYKHIGQLQTLQKLLDVNSKFIDAGIAEAQEQLADILHPNMKVITNEVSSNALVPQTMPKTQEIVRVPQNTPKAFKPLAVTSIAAPNSTPDQEVPCDGNDMCVLCDVDDEF